MSVSDGAFSVKITDEKHFAAQRCVGPDAKVLQVGYMDVRSHHRRRKTRTFRTTCVPTGVNSWASFGEQNRQSS